MAITNTGTVDINSLAIIIEIYDPDEQKAAAQDRVEMRDLRGGETRNITASVRAHCRGNYTIRAFARY